MADTGPDTILLDLFRTNQVRERLIAAALEGLPLPPDDYPFYVLIGAEGPLTPTALADRTQMPLSTVLYRTARLERRGHAERRENPDDRRSYLLALTPEGQKLLGKFGLDSAVNKPDFKRWYGEQGMSVEQYEKESGKWEKLLREIGRK